MANRAFEMTFVDHDGRRHAQWHDSISLAFADIHRAGEKASFALVYNRSDAQLIYDLLCAAVDGEPRGCPIPGMCACPAINTDN